MSDTDHMNYAYPSHNPSEGYSMGSAMAGVFSKFLQKVDDCLPARVISYDRATNTATVQPLVAMVTTAGTRISRSAIAAVPVFASGAGEFCINFPVKPGDLGWIKASDRDISLFKQSLSETKPNTRRKHSFEDGVFFPDMIRNFTVDAEDVDANLVIQSRDGKIRVALWPDRVRATADRTWLEVRDNGTITATAPDKIVFDAPLVEFAGIFKSGTKHSGQLSEMDGGLKTTMDQIAGGVSTMRHPHTDVMPGSGRSGLPVVTE